MLRRRDRAKSNTTVGSDSTRLNNNIDGLLGVLVGGDGTRNEAGDGNGGAILVPHDGASRHGLREIDAGDAAERRR